MALLFFLPTDTVAQTKKSGLDSKKTTRTLRVVQGDVGRWPGNCRRCAMEAQSWEPVNGTCYYPVDMETKPGRYAISRRTTGGKLESASLLVMEKTFPEEDFKNFKKAEYVNVSAKNLSRNKTELARVLPLLKASREERPAVFDLPLGKPAANLPNPENNFGAHRTFDGKERDRHTGDDYPLGAGQSVLSVGNGRVLLAENHFFSGNSVFIDHGNGLISEYFHLKDLNVKKAQTVKKGEKIGEVGQTGRTTGPHLHLGIRWHGARIRPGLLLIDPAELPMVTEQP
ncbi:MAG: M23 family metallopeptidase [Sphingobacteriaceae bacterium]|nr:M23 family metallopeptidase [Cytophagaceae bacterium]